jgi:hypothetical protein
VMDQALRKVTKEYPYYSGKFTASANNGKLKNLNGLATFLAVANEQSEPIVCRHLAMHFFENSAKNIAAKFDYQAFNDIEAIQNSVKPEIKSRFDIMLARATETHMIDNKEFGNFLVSQFTEMEQCDKKTKVALVCSENHALGFSLRIKEKDGMAFYAVRFYDPNRTNGHARNSSSTINTFSSLSVQSYLDEEKFGKYYFPGSDAVCSIFMHDSKIDKPHQQKIQRPRKLTSIRCNISEQMIHAIFIHGFDRSLRDLKPAFQKMSLHERMTLLGNVNQTTGVPGFRYSCDYGFSNMVGEFSDLLELIPPEKRFALLEGIDDNLPILHAMVVLKERAVIAAFAIAIRRLPYERQSEFLESQCYGTSAMETALREGDAGVIATYADLIIAVKKENIEHAKLLLMARDEKGQPFLHSVVMSGQQSEVESYAIAISRLDQSDRVAMCSVPDSDSVPPLFRALELGNAAAIHGFKALLQVIPTDDRVELLVTKDASGKSGVQCALENGHADAIDAYSNLLEMITPVQREALRLQNAKGHEVVLNGPTGADFPIAYAAYMLLMEQ